MKVILKVISYLSILFFILISPLLAVNKPPMKGETLPSFFIPVPKDIEGKKYLGLSGDGFFKIPQIKAKVVVIEIFSMYCPYCQKDAPGINELYDLIEKNLDLRGRIKIIGIGAGNTAYEVGIYKKKYSIPFPLFPDRDFTIHKAFGEVRTPYFIIVKINEDGTHQIVHAQLGGYPGAEPFLELILKVSELN